MMRYYTKYIGGINYDLEFKVIVLFVNKFVMCNIASIKYTT